ncbi:MAG TPA: hypothetical protein VN461_22275 [Vicinamibacteria bacterium]|nr:hypothetical protein [Vicinamibacteria bacterium]
MCPSSAGRPRRFSTIVPFVALVLFPVADARAGARFEVSGTVEATESEIAVRVNLRNVGDRATGSVSVEGEFLGRRQEGTLDQGVPAGESRSLLLRYPPEVPRRGVHPLTLLLDFAEAASPANASPPAESQRAFLLLALGANAPPAVRVDAAEGRLETRSSLAVGLESLDGASHRVRLRVLTPHGLRAENPPADVEVPAAGRVSVPIPLLRSGAPRGSRQGVLFVAEAADGPLARTTVTTGVVEIAPDPALMPRLRLPLWVLAGLLLATAVALEFRRRREKA